MGAQMKIVIAAAISIALVSVAPIAVQAQQRIFIPVDQEVPAAPPHSDRMNRDNLLAIGVGVVVGAIAAPFLYPIDGVPLIGAALGGIIGDYWYNVGSDVVLRLHAN
jgi:hypothetical protein